MEPKTNRETLEWLNKNSSNQSEEQWLKDAKVFFNNIPGKKQAFRTWRNNFIAENRKLKREAQQNLMKACGGTGRYGDIPPRGYFPEDIPTITLICQNACDKIFQNQDEFKDHIRTAHATLVKKAYSKEARENIIHERGYNVWLDQITFVDLKNKLKEKNYCNKLEKANEYLKERNVEIANALDSDAIFKVGQKGNIIEAKRNVYTNQPDGTVKKTVVTEQFANVTKRTKRKSGDDAENVDPNAAKITSAGERKQAETISDVLSHICGEDIEARSRLVAKLVDKEGPKFASTLTANSKELKATVKFTPTETASLISATGTADRTFDQLRTACIKKLGTSPFASRHQVEKVREEILPINISDWETTYHDLYKNKQGHNAHIKKRTCVLSVRNLKDYITKIAESEADTLKVVDDDNEQLLPLCLDGDGGGGRFVCEFAFLNTVDKKLKLHPFLIYEGTDVRENLEVTLGVLTSQFRALEGSKITVKGNVFKITMFGMFDLSALNSILGKQSHSATYFDAWTNCRLDHIQNHSGKQHIPSECKEISFLSFADFDKNLTHHSVDNGIEKASGKHFGSVVADNLLPLKNISRYIPPLMHIIMGLGNNLFNELKRTVIELDNNENDSQRKHQKSIQIQLKDIYDEKENLSVTHANNSLDKMIVLNDIERITLLVQGKQKEASDVAKQNYAKHSKKKKNDCNAEHCIIYPHDEEHGFADVTKCDKCGGTFHVRCEGIILMVDDQFQDEYTCKKCIYGVGNSEWLEATLREGAHMLTDTNQQLSLKLTTLKMTIEKLEEEDSKCGPRQKLLKDSCTLLKLNPARYHGGDFEGKAIQVMLECARNEKYELLICIKDQEELFEKFRRALDTLQQVSDVLKAPIDHFNDKDVKVVQDICEQWGINWPVDFPHLNITPKAHDMIFVLPEIVKRRRSFFMFYKMEEKGESIHAELNNIQRKIWCIRDPAKRLWKYIERYELRNIVDMSIVTPYKRIFRNK